MPDWDDTAALHAVVWEQTDRCLNVYAKDPSRVLQDANNERRIAGGGYADRQLEELVQNATDAARRGGGRIEVRLVKDCLYVANDGEPFDAEGIRSVMASDVSTKDDERIGKFGIGFKSLLAISDSPRVLSQTVGFAFDRDWAEATLRAEGYKFTHYPAMRLAKTLDARVEAERDPNLRELMTWASTIIVAPLKVPHFALSRRLYNFPSEFTLFSPHIHTAVLRNDAEPDPDARGSRKGRPQLREIKRTVLEDGLVEIAVTGAKPQRWAVASREHAPSKRALADGGHAAARETLQVDYALPASTSQGLGTFWAYFPTKFQTTLSGIINAPWKLSDDRTGLLEGDFNEELLSLLPELVAEAMRMLRGEEFASAIVDAMPARGDESRNWADRVINEPIFARLRKLPSIPNDRGELSEPARLRWAPDATIDWLEQWSDIQGAPRGAWLHRSLYSTAERRSKVERLFSRVSSPRSGSHGAAGLDGWLEALLDEPTVACSSAAIALAAAVVRDCDRITDVSQRQRVAGAVRQAKIVLLEDGGLAAPSRGKVFVRIPGETASGVQFVDPQLASGADVRENLARLGVVVMDRSGEVRALLAKIRDLGPRADELWSRAWVALRTLPADAAVELLREELAHPLVSEVRVRTAAGSWKQISQVLLPGEVIPAAATRDREYLIDPSWHSDDVVLLRAIGAVDAPVRRHDTPRENWMDRYEQMAFDRFIESQTGSRPDRTKLTAAGTKPAWPMGLLEQLSPEGRAAMTEQLLRQGLDEPWVVAHQSNASYGRLRVPSPQAWLLNRYATFRTSFGLLSAGRVMRSGEDVDERVLPAIELPDDIADALDIKHDEAEFSADDWKHLKSIADRWAADDEADKRRAEFYTWLPGRFEPESLLVRVGHGRQQVAPAHIGATSDRGAYDSLIEAQIPALLVDDDADVERFCDLWGMSRAADLLEEEITTEPSGESVYLLDEFPPLKLYLAVDDFDLRIQAAARIVKMIPTPRGQIARPIAMRREGDTIFTTASEPRERLAQIGTALGRPFTAVEIDSILRQMADAESDQRRVRIRAASDIDGKLLEAVSVEALRRSIPRQALEILEQRPEGVADRDIASLARATHGVSILKQLRPALEEAGLQPPKEWAGRKTTRNWVGGLGFPIEWAGFPGSSRPALEVIDGPAQLNELHGYQKFVTRQIQAMLRGVGEDRGIVALPTGAGKTRVTVQALIEGIRDGDLPLNRPILWIAQTDELCEQAAETWTYVWRAIGPRAPMLLGRLWGDNEASEEPGSFQLIVASIQKLARISEREGGAYDWLSDPSIVVVDEAHTSIAASYTEVLRWLGRIDRTEAKQRKLLLGLTATPFRGVDSDVETKRLIRRYKQNRLDRGAFLRENPYQELQEMGVLAQVRHEVLDGIEVSFSPDEVREIEKWKTLPDSVVEALGTDVQRTLRVADAISRHPEDWTILAFAPSVENARVLAALLSHRGIPSVAISADTEPAARRHYIDEFKAGRIRVLTNYNVLSQGFDAPKVQAVYVARPTFTPNIYQQMIGRGLRGVKNGGSSEVLIVNVRDSFNRFGELLAFDKFEHLWVER